MESGTVLDRAYFERDTVTVARELLGTVLVFERPTGVISRVRIVETEAYVGPRIARVTHRGAALVGRR